MPNVFWAEWLIARFTDPSRAASIVGDLLEAATEQGTLWFWLSAVEIVLSLTWRRLVAFVVAFLFLSSLRALPMPVYAPLHGIPPVHEPTESWWPFFAFIGRFGMLLWIVAPYLAVRYGLRDRFSQLAMALCVPLTTAIFYWWRPGVVATCIALTLSIVVYSAALAQWRRSFVALALSLVFGVLGFQFTVFVAAWYLELASPSVSLTSRVNNLVSFFGVIILTVACGGMHRLLVCRDQGNLETELPT
jgi:hypothetical protein